MAEAAAAGLVYIPKHRKSSGSPNTSHHHPHHQQNTGIYQTIFGSPHLRARTKSLCVDPKEEGKDGKSPDDGSINSQESVYYSDASESSMTSCKL
jgi:uncharacterized beta-barrel protein YwiB (DUF1934 family)